MTKRTAILSLLCLSAAACGGKDSSGNTAASKQFTYGQSAGATPAQAGALQSSLSAMTTLEGTPDVTSAASFTEFSSVTDALLGTYSFGAAQAAASAQKKALTTARSAALFSPTSYGLDFDNPGCVAVTSTSVTLTGCRLKVTETSGSETATATVTADGSVTLGSAGQTLKWDLTFAVSVTISGGGASGSGGGRFHAAGDLTVQAPTASADGTIKGTMTSEVSVNASAGGQSASLRVDESLAIDITYRTSPSACVTGGSLEAKRVFAEWSVPEVARPSDKGAKIAFTSGACNSGTIQFSL
jgi:hypothetical protein